MCAAGNNEPVPSWHPQGPPQGREGASPCWEPRSSLWRPPLFSPIYLLHIIHQHTHAGPWRHT